MPQMMPMLWIMMLASLIIILLTIISSLYFFTLLLSQFNNSNKYLKIKNYWSWMW